MVLTHRHIHYSVIRKGLDPLRLLEVDAIFIAVPKNAPVTLTECVNLAILADKGGVAQPNAQLLHVQLIVSLDSLRVTLRHLEVRGDGASFGSKAWHF